MRLKLQNDGKFTISGDKGESITLSGQATVVMLNLPVSMLEGKPPADNGDHFTIYCEMTGDLACKYPDPAAYAGLSACGEANVMIPSAARVPVSPHVPNSNPNNALDIFCSSSQWP
jgi:hypothetical protein